MSEIAQDKQRPYWDRPEGSSFEDWIIHAHCALCHARASTTSMPEVPGRL